MDELRFDALTRTFSSRRTALAGVVSSVATLLALTGIEEASAHNLLPKCRRIADPTKRRRCLRRARAHKRNKHSCKPKPKAVTCKNRCGTTQNNCKKKVNCTCPAGKPCLLNQSCARPCADQGDCPVGCLCSPFTALEGGRFCLPAVVLCEQVPQVCASIAQCPLGFHCMNTGCVDGGQPRCVPPCQG